MAGADDVKQVVEAAVEEAVGRLKTELANAIAEGLPATPAAPAASGGGSSVAATELSSSLLSFFAGGGQVEGLNRLLDQVGTLWDRVVVYLVKGESFQPWSATGFAGGVGDAAAKAHVVSSSADTILASALGGAGSQSGNARLSEGLGAPSGPAAAVPLSIRGKAAAVVYCDGPKVPYDDAVALLELVAKVAAAAIELGMLTKQTGDAVPTAAARGDLASAAAVAAPAAGVPAIGGLDFSAAAAPAVEPEVVAAPEAVAPPEPATDFGFGGAAPSLGSLAPGLSGAAPAVSGAAPAVEAPSFEMPAPVAPEPAAAEVAAPEVAATPEPAAAGDAPKKFSRWTPVRQQLKSGGEEDPALAQIPEAERPKHVDAKKIARLLVSEIKLYNEAKVAVGRKNKDLYERLKDDIERSRKSYTDRVDAGVAVSTDYFRDELVETLAEGDASVLGMDA